MIKHIYIIWTTRLNVQRGGVHRVIKILLEHLPKYGYDMHYLYTSDHYATFHHYEADDEDRAIPVSELRDYLVENKCDLLIGQDGGFSPVLSSLVRKWTIPGMKYVMELHNSLLLMERSFSRHYWAWQIRQGISLATKFAALTRLTAYPLWLRKCRKSVVENYRVNYEAADRILLLSQREIGVIRDTMHCDTSRCVVINNPLSWEKIASADILHNKKKEVLIVSRLYNPEKRIDRALRIWAILEYMGFDDWQLRIVGTGVHETYLRNLATKLGLKRVTFEGRQDSYPYYLTASIFMMTSSVEGWGLTLTESMQTGTVPVAFDSYPAIHDIITDGYDGCLVEDDDMTAYANIMAELMSNAEKREQIALNGLESCRRFTIDKIISRWVEMISQL